ncbi:pyrimidine 5'-nucleotidase [Glaesserella parasuis]|uniref:Pyrimidine 5'-nucleotidase n=4 Tax=Glaesserella parasuis TaxID=738 RepID=A0A084ELF1_GLAPU|nr:pyrimidine 5'-nucleotidase [Glaesserella parasuis]AGO16763.1 dUMP phosphatase [Glaesserella parasuis ZJ0906]EPZ99601.1 pyrimidine nucleotidase [Glaesserella parasuis SW114]EQA04807.1 pyrimidine 5'-nucleotidase YjjG [Glaesserella parasuis 12939]ACL33559.1 nucleotidase/putative HAD superfamily haloacid dehalogenase-like hydrolase [Glaesserella parasuis SH0165]AIK17563.1 dUMP phosphatase [Glaesserella parasuis]
MKYQWILFDADETLFSFNSYLGLQAVLACYGIEFSQDDYEAFQAVNKPLWLAYQNQEITIEQLQICRFSNIAKKIGKDELALNNELMLKMAVISKPLSGTIEVLEKLFGIIRMGIITNGLEILQKKRLENTNTEKYFDIVISSEVAGVPKPDERIFKFAFQQMGDINKSRILMVGDTLSSDILGANQIGIDSCWFNPCKEVNHTEIKPTYEITDLKQLLNIVLS